MRSRRFMNVKSFPAILGRVADAIQPFGFKFVEHDLLPPVPEGGRKGLGQPGDFSDQPGRRQADELKRVHPAFLFAAGWRASFR